MAQMNESLVQALHDQLHREHQAHFFYRQAAFWFDLNLYPGSAAFFKVSTSYN